MKRLLLLLPFVALASQAQLHPKAGTFDFLGEVSDWIVLFNGHNLDGWKGFHMDHIPAGWSVADGCMVRDPSKEHGDIATIAEFGDFELTLEWAIAEGGNSGIMFRCTEDHEGPYETGPEMQVLDDDKHPDGKNVKTSAGSDYALYAPVGKKLKPVGQFNTVRILAKGPHVEYWLNGVKVVQYEIGSPEWTALVKGSKFGAMPDYGLKPRGKIDLQDHGDVVRFRNIKIRRL